MEGHEGHEGQREKALMAGAKVAVAQCLGVQAGETVLVITDEYCRDVGEALWRAAEEAKADPLLLFMRPRDTHGEEPPRPVAEAMKVAAVCVAPTSRSLTHTLARRQASAAGARIASMPGITAEMMARALAVNYEEIAELTEKVARILDEGETVRVATSAGTDLILSIRGRKSTRDTGIYRQPGDFGNLPAGEAYIAPIETSGKGRIVVNGSMAGLGVLDHPIIMDIKEGRAVSITGGSEADKLIRILDRVGADARIIGELGIGTNPAARIIGNVLEDEKVLGTVHIALGANASFGGEIQVACHLDGILLKPTLWVDGTQLMCEGQLII